MQAYIIVDDTSLTFPKKIVKPSNCNLYNSIGGKKMKI
jgi:hypothetical protein